jgi:DNA sulfur modification protein DndB
MATIIPAIRGRLGNTTYYETTMKVSDLVKSVRAPRELDEWTGFSIEERLQREPDVKRIRSDLAPYIANNQDRFFGSIIVLVYRGALEFESITSFVKQLPAAYRSGSESMGFITIDGVTLVVLDGQHRLLALKAVHLEGVSGPASETVGNDDVCVIFVEHEDFVKTRRIFNVVNRYAKQTGRGDNIITSEDDGYAIVARALLADDEVFGRREVNGEKRDFVEWKSNTLGKRSLPFTTISAVYESVKLILAHHSAAPQKETRPSVEELEQQKALARGFFELLMDRVALYAEASRMMTRMPELRADDQPTALLFKPAGQIAVVDAVFRAVNETGLPVETALDRLNAVDDWSMSNPLWRDIIVKGGGTIDAGPDARRRMSALLAYLLAADRMDAGYKLATWRMFNDARRRGAADEWERGGFVEPSELEDLPDPTAGVPFTVADARAMLEAAAESTKAA